MKSSAGKGIVYLASSTIVFLIAGYLMNIWLGRYFGPRVYGQYGVIISLIGAINLLQTSGLPQALSKFLAEDEVDSISILRSAFVLQVLFTLLLTAIYLSLAKPIGVLLHDENLIPYIQLSAFILPFYSIFALYTGYYNGTHNFKGQSLINIIYSISKFVGVVILTYLFKLFGAIIGFIIAPILILFYGLPLPRKRLLKFSYKKMLLVSLPLMGFVILNNFEQVIDLYFVKSITHSDLLTGYYTANQNITKLPYIGFCTFIGVLFPMISKNVSQNLHQESRDLIHQVIRVIVLLLIPLTLLISATSSEVVQLLYSKNYLPASTSLAVLIIGFTFLIIYTILANVLNGAGKAKKSVWISAIDVLITSLSCLILIPKYGLVGAALASSLGSLAAMIIAAYFVYQEFNALVNPLGVLKIVFASLVIYFIARFVSVTPLFLPILYIVLFGAYFGILVLLKEINHQDIVYVNNLLPTRFRLRKFNV